MELVKKLNIKTLNDVFGTVASASGVVFWMRSTNYKQQCYISPNYEKIWGHSCNELYSHPESWMETLFAEDRTNLTHAFQKRIHEGGSCLDTRKPQVDTLLFRVIKPDAKILYIRDRSFTLTNSTGDGVIAGIGQPLNSAQWEYEHKQLYAKNASIYSLENAVLLLLSQVLQLVPLPTASKICSDASAPSLNVFYQGRPITLTVREAQCLYYSAQGYSAKQIGYCIHLSPRTIETYLGQIKQKAGCRTKLQLLSHIDMQSLEHLKQILPNRNGSI